MVLWKRKTQCTLIKLSWEGGYERSKTFTGVEKAVQLGFSVNHGFAGYWQKRTGDFCEKGMNERDQRMKKTF